MTKEELKEHCKRQVECCEMWARNNGGEPHGKVYEEHKLVLDLINTLEQSGEDCVSREQALLALTGTNLGEKSADELIALFDKRMRALPPVTPTRKVGKWIRKPIRNEKGGCIGAEMICSYCKKDNEQDKKLAYCPNCGAKMEGDENE